MKVLKSLVFLTWSAIDFILQQEMVLRNVMALFMLIRMIIIAVLKKIVFYWYQKVIKSHGEDLGD